MTTERLDIVVAEQGAQGVERKLRDVGGAADGVSKAVGALQKILAAWATFETVRRIVEIADAYTNIQNRLRTVTDGTAELAVVTDRLFQISNRTRASFASTAELYARMGNAAKELGVSQEEVLGFTESLNQAVALSGASAAEASAGIIQLSQGLASGALRGDELRSVLEQLPTVADVIAKSLGVTRGELRQLGVDGKITAEVVFEAFKKARGELAERFAESVPTIAQAFVVLQNNVTRFVGELATSSGASEAFARAILLVSEHVDDLAKGLAVLGSAVAVAFAPALIERAVGLLVGGIRAITAAIAANPIGALLVGITAATTALVLFGDEVKVTEDGLVTLKDVASVVWDDTVATISDVAASIAGPLMSALSAWIKGTDNVSASTHTLWDDTKTVINSIVGLFVGAAAAVKFGFERIPAAVGDIFTRLINDLTQKLEDFVNTVILSVNSIAEYIPGVEALKPVTLGRLVNVFEGGSDDLGKAIGASFQVAMNTDYVGNAIDGVLARARERAQARISEAGALPGVDLSASSGGSAAGATSAADAKEVEKLGEAIRQLRGQLDPMVGVQNAVADAQEQINKALRAGIIPASDAASLNAQLLQHYRDELDPLGAVNRQLDEQARLLGMTSQQREIETQMLQLENDLRGKGVDVTQAELVGLRQRLTLQQQQARALAVEERTYESIVGPAQAYGETLGALNSLLDQGRITYAQYIEAMETLQDGFLENQKGLDAGISRGVRQIREQFGDFGRAVQGTMVKAFGDAKNAVVDFVQTGKASFGDFVDYIFDAITELLVSGIFSELANGMSGGGGKGGGGMDWMGLFQQGVSLVGSWFGGGGGSAPYMYGSGHEGNAVIGGRNMNPSVSVPASVFANVPRYHSGTPFLGADEVPFIGKKGEMVGWPSQMREAFGGGGSSTEVNITIENNSGAKASVVRDDQELNVRNIKILIEDTVAGGLSSPSSNIHRAARNTFGLNASRTPR